MSWNKIHCLIKKEFLYNLRNKRLLILLCAIFLLLMLSVVMYIQQASELGGYNLNTLVLQNYNIIIQILALALIPILSSCISSEKEVGTWLFYRMNGIKKEELVASKIIFYNSIIILFLILSFVFEIIIMKLFFNLSFTSVVPVKHQIYIFILVFSIISLIINSEILISEMTKKSVNAAIYVIIVWFSLMIINGILPYHLGGGYIAPFTQNSIQTSVMWRLLQNATISPIPFESRLYLPTLNELAIALSIPIVLNIFIIIISLKRRDKIV